MLVGTISAGGPHVSQRLLASRCGTAVPCATRLFHFMSQTLIPNTK